MAMKKTLLSFLGAILAHSSIAATYYVATNGNDSWNGLATAWDGANGPKLTIQAGINTASQADTLRISPGFYSGQGNVNLTNGGKYLFLQGSTNSMRPVIDCQVTNRFLTISGQAMVLESLFVQNASATSTVAAVECSQISSVAYNLLIKDCEFYGCNRVLQGYTSGTRLPNTLRTTVSGCLMASNASLILYPASVLILTNSTFRDSTPDDAGVIQNQIYMRPRWPDPFEGEAIIRNSTFSRLVSSNNAPIYIDSGHAFVADSSFASNANLRLNGGAIGWDYSPDGGDNGITISNCSFVGNYAKGSGGAVAAYCPQIVRSSFTGNIADREGGAVAFLSTVSLVPKTFADCVFAGNRAGTNGGAILMRASCNYTNCLFVENTTTNKNSAIYSAAAGLAVFQNCTFASNSCPAGSLVGGFVDFFGSPYTTNSFVNCILWANGSSTFSGLFQTAVVADISFSDTDVTGISSGSNNINLAPQFRGNGNYHLASSSPCIDAGTTNGAPPADLDGVPRPYGAGIDIGAYEWSPTVDPIQLTVAGVAASNKVYDGTTTAEINAGSASLVGVLPQDLGNVSLVTNGLLGHFTNKSVGTGKVVTVSGFTLTGSAAGNYTLVQPILIADIFPAGSACILNSSANPAAPTSNVLFTVTVSGVSPTADNPTGVVVFFTNGVPLSTNALAINGTASANTSVLPLGTTTVSVQYAGDGNFLGSNTNLQQFVQFPATCSQTNTVAGIAPHPDGTLTLTFQGTPGAQYCVLSQTNINYLMGDWAVLPNSTNTVNAFSGLWSFTVTNAGQSGFYRAKALSVCSTAPVNMALVSAGPFTMGDTSGDATAYNWTWELPAHTVYVSAFYMDMHEVTKVLWETVRTWGVTNAYGFDNSGSGKAALHPVHSMSWYDCVKWCNARSEMEQLTPCYYSDAGLSAVCKTGQVVYVNWSANGYRLPTEAEWEKAARGGAANHRFPWSIVETISHNRANYNSVWTSGHPQYPFDVNATNGYPTQFNDGVPPYTSPVGSFASNDYGLFDMAGNVWEWCWDWTGRDYTSSPETNPHGPATGSSRVFRGGGWSWNAAYARAAFRSNRNPAGVYDYVGFRCVRNVPQP